MSEAYSTKQLLALRRVTRSASELVSGQLKDFLQTVGHAFRPRTTFGEYVASPIKESAFRADVAFADLKTLYNSVASSKPFLLRKEFPEILDNMSIAPELTTWEYSHRIQSSDRERSIAITSPLKWTLHYAGYPPKRLFELIRDREHMADDLQKAILHYLAMHIVLQRQPGILRLFSSLRMPIETGKLEGCGELPVAIIRSIVPTLRPQDEVVIESTEISGRDAFEEVVDLQAIHSLSDPWKIVFTDMIGKEAELSGMQ